jgi:hypothetical protein
LFFIFEALLSTSSLNSTDKLKAIINVRQLYNSCIDENTIEKNDLDVILSLINREFGGWPILQGSAWNSSQWNFSQVLFKLSEYNTNIFYRIKTNIDDENSSIYSIQVSIDQLI